MVLQAEKRGQEGELRGKIREFKRELKDDMYKGAEDKWKRAMVESHTIKMANEDLNKYHFFVLYKRDLPSLPLRRSPPCGVYGEDLS